MGIGQRRRARQLAYFGAELARAVVDNGIAVAHAVALADAHLPGQDHQHARIFAARDEDRFSIGKMADGPEAMQARAIVL